MVDQLTIDHRQSIIPQMVIVMGGRVVEIFRKTEFYGRLSLRVGKD